MIRPQVTQLVGGFKTRKMLRTFVHLRVFQQLMRGMKPIVNFLELPMLAKHPHLGLFLTFWKQIALIKNNLAKKWQKTVNFLCQKSSN